MQDFLADIFGSCSAPPPSSGGESSDFLEKLWGKFWGRIFCKFWGRIFSASFGAESSLQVLGENLPPVRGENFWQVLGQNLLPRSLPPAAKTPKLPRYKRGDARTSVHLPPPSTSLVESPPPSVSLRATAPSGFPRCRGLCPLGGACSPGGPVPLFGLGFGTLFITPLSTPILREGMCPALGSALIHHKRLGHTVHWVHPKSCPSRARGPVGGGGCPLSVVDVVYGSFVATLVLARGCPAGGTLRVEETSGHRHSDQDTGYVGGSGVGLSPVLSLGFPAVAFGSP